MLFFAAVFAAFCFSSCEEEKEEQVDVQIKYYCLSSGGASEHENIYVREYSASDELLRGFVVAHLGAKEETSYLPAHPDANYLFLFYETTYCSSYDSTIYNFYQKQTVMLHNGNNYIVLAGGEEITEQEFRELQKAKKK